MSGSRRRARIGVIIPSTNTSVEADYNELAPAGVSFHVARIFINNAIESDDKQRETLRQIREGTERAVHDVMTCQPDHLVMGMSSETFVGGLKGSREFLARVRELSGLKVTAGSDATRMVLESIGARRIGVLTPYQPRLDGEVAKYFDDLGYEMVAMTSLRSPTAISIADVTDEEILAKLDELAAAGDVDAFVQAGTNLSSYHLAETVEQRHGTPLVAINAACVAHALTSCGIDDPLPAAGSVFAKPLIA